MIILKTKMYDSDSPVKPANLYQPDQKAEGNLIICGNDNIVEELTFKDKVKRWFKKLFNKNK